MIIKGKIFIIFIMKLGNEQAVVFMNSWLKQYQGDCVIVRKIEFYHKMFLLYIFILSSVQK
jgi:hypothetical protein